MAGPLNSFDFIVIGSGFGGSVTAMRLSQKGYRVAILEKGSRYQTKDFPRTNWNLRKFIWAPIIKCFGIQQISLLKGVMVLHGAGVGGGSLVYANTLMQPKDEVLQQSGWPKSLAWRNKLKRNYTLAKKMLGVTTNQKPALADHELKNLANHFREISSYHLTEVGVFFGNDSVSKNNDPYFSGEGPPRKACTGCGGCMIGCSVGAKNTLDKNYLFFAEKWGTEIFAGLLVEKIEKTENGYSITTKKVKNWMSNGPTFSAKKIVISAGVLGTLKILFENKIKHRTLPMISDRLGEDVRTNGESLCGASSLRSEDFSQGIAIGSAFHIGAEIKVEPVRYPIGSNAMKLLAVPLTDEIPGIQSFKSFFRVLNLVKSFGIYFLSYFKIHWLKDWARQTVILLVMQSKDEKMKLKYGRSFFHLFRRGLKIDDKHSSSVPSYIPFAQEASKRLAQQIEGMPQNIISEVAFKTPATAHILGGIPNGNDESSGVVDENLEVFNYPGLYICDGSVIPTNLGVNPSLTIAAIAETFAEQFPKKDPTLQREINFT